MTFRSALRLSFLTLSALQLAIAGVAVPQLFAQEDGRGDLAAWHCIILSAIALAAIVGLTKPKASISKAKP